MQDARRKASGRLKITQITHHDLDGYGASTIVRAYSDVGRVVHVSRYADVGPVVATELQRLTRAGEPEMLIVTDLGLEAPTVTFIKNFASMNAKRAADRHHRLVVLDHHASSLDQLAAQAVPVAPWAGTAWPSLHRFTLDDPSITIIVDETRCATKLAHDHRDLYASRAADPAVAATLEMLVEAIDTVDLWAKDRPLFRPALVLDEIFWDNVSGFIPLDHPWHDRFIGDLLLGMAGRLGGAPAAIETDAGAVRRQVIDRMLAGEPGDDATQTTRMRIAPLLARSPALFHRLADGAKLSFGLDAGTFQRVSDVIMTSGEAALVINVQRSGSMSFRSIDQTALDAARKFRGGGHKDAAGGRLVNAAVSLADAVAQVEAVLSPPKPDLSKRPCKPQTPPSPTP